MRQIVSLTGDVSSAEGFTEQAEVMNGASGALTEIFGEDAGRPTRSSVGVVHMPRSGSVGVCAVVEIAPGLRG